MQPNTFEHYLSWRREHLEHRYWKLTSAIRLTGILVFVPFVAVVTLLLLVYRGDPRIASYIGGPLSVHLVLIGGAIVFTLVSALAIHASARFRREEVLEELEVIYALPTPSRRPSVEWDTARNEYQPTERQFA